MPLFVSKHSPPIVPYPAGPGNCPPRPIVAVPPTSGVATCVPRVPTGWARSAVAARRRPVSTTSVGKPATCRGMIQLPRAAISAGLDSFSLTRNTRHELPAGAPLVSLVP
ncbi:MAG: hypothetical protein ACJ8F1_15920 [Polyangia bacterium]